MIILAVESRESIKINAGFSNLLQIKKNAQYVNNIKENNKPLKLTGKTAQFTAHHLHILNPTIIL